MKSERIKQLQIFLDVNGKATFEQLEKRFPDVSKMTIRRDVAELARQGSVMQVKNGAVSLLELTRNNGEVTSRANLFIFEKQLIAEKAVSLVRPEQKLFIDAGSTTTFFARELPDKPFNVYTNGITIIEELVKKTQPEIVAVGGKISKMNQSTFGRDSELFLQSVQIDVAIMATTAFSARDGFSCGERADAELKSYIISKAKKRIMLLDSSKINKSLAYTFAKAENIDVLVVDDGFPQELKTQFKLKGVKVL